MFQVKFQAEASAPFIPHTNLLVEDLSASIKTTLKSSPHCWRWILEQRNKKQTKWAICSSNTNQIKSKRDWHYTFDILNRVWFTPWWFRCDEQHEHQEGQALPLQLHRRPAHSLLISRLIALLIFVYIWWPGNSLLISRWEPGVTDA